jgi:hypothetical protein
MPSSVVKLYRLSRGVALIVTADERNFISYTSKIFQISHGAHSAFYLMGTCLLSWGAEQPARDVEHSPSYSAKVNKEWSHTSAPSICFHGPEKDIFTWRHCSQDNNLDALLGKRSI